MIRQCQAHEENLISKYSHLQNKCCDPFKKHKKAVRSSLKMISLEVAKRFRDQNTHISIKMIHPAAQDSSLTVKLILYVLNNWRFK